MSVLKAGGEHHDGHHKNDTSRHRHHSSCSCRPDKRRLFSTDQKTSQTKEYDETIAFPSDRYPETAKHIKDAINEGHSEVCTIDRDGAEERREQSLKDVPSKRGMTEMNGQWPCAKKAVRELL